MLADQRIERFSVSPAAVDWINDDGTAWTWVTDEILFEDLGVDGLAYRFVDDYDGREWRITEVRRDEPGRAEWRTNRGSTCTARPVRPYDAVALRLAPEPLPPEDVMMLRRSDAERPGSEVPGTTLLDLDPAVVWFDEPSQRERCSEVAAMIEHDLLGARTIQRWRRFVGVGHLGWAPMTVPVRAYDLGYRNSRFVSPAVAEMLWRGEKTGFAREHVVSRSRIAEEWESCTSVDDIEKIVWDYRFAVVLTTADEAKRIDRMGGRVGRWERYLEAGMPTVYDRLLRRDVHVAALDPRSPMHGFLEDREWDGRFVPPEPEIPSREIDE